MNAEDSFCSAVAEQLPDLDAELAAGGTAVAERPFPAALNFSRLFVLEIKDGEKQWRPDLSSAQFVTEKWFRALYQEVEDWYRKRYGAAFEEVHPRIANGFVLIWGTPFALKVPLTVLSPGTPGKTVWVSFPDSVLPTENPVRWLASPPNLKEMPASDLAEVTAACQNIASLLRSIEVSMLGIHANSSIVQRFLTGTRFHREVAAEHMIREPKQGVTQRAYWEIQMACECAYKALLQQKTGTFLETHDLFRLHDKAAPYRLTIGRDNLKKLPRWKEMVELRYGQAIDPTATGFYEAYRTMLLVVDAVLAPLVTLWLGKASLEIAKAPWLPEDEDA